MKDLARRFRLLSAAIPALGQEAEDASGTAERLHKQLENLRALLPSRPVPAYQRCPVKYARMLARARQDVRDRAWRAWAKLKPLA